ncbi:MAG: helix-turn-helix domain-containing protein [Firmicutes bacterium]|nr:helix-turn-helix domain-containing protein [Bacillota bacterium]MCL5038826.1 helix-turn-helix domain-containing protein [Bacillota bacterium]
MDHVGAEIRRLRRQRGLTLKELADRVGLSTSYLSEVERELKRPSIEALERLTGLLRIPLGSLIPVTQAYDAGMATGMSGRLGKKLKQLRESMDLSQAELAQRAGLSGGLIGQIESGKTRPSLKTVQRLADALGVSPCYLVSDTDNLEEFIKMLNPELRQLLVNPTVQTVLNMMCTLNDKEIQFLLRFIQLFKESGITQGLPL